MRDLLIENLDLVDRVVAFTCRRQRLDETEAEDFASTVKLKLIENDYGVLRKFEGRSSFATFLTVVVQRLFLDYQIHHWGKWHASAEATRLGEVAVGLERILLRDGRTIEEAFAVLSARYPGLTPDALATLASRLPPRPPKRKHVDIEEAAVVASPQERPDGERARTSTLVSEVVRTFIDALPAEDRLVLQLRFDGDMTIAQIARSMHLDQKQLYRRMERRLRQLRETLEVRGVGAADARDLVGDRGVILDFQLGNEDRRPSISAEETITPGQEEVSR